MAENRSALIRNKIADYLDCGKDGTVDWRLMGIGFTQLNESPNAQSESTTYINEVTAQSDITKYETEFSYNSDFIPDQKPVIVLYNDGRDHHVGSEAQHSYVRVDLWNPIGEPSAAKAEYKARVFTVSNEVSSIEGDGGEKITVTGALKAMGDPVQGKFDVIAKEFTEGEFVGKFDEDSKNTNTGGGGGGSATRYTEVTPDGTEDPSALGWYEFDGTNYTLSTDTTVDSSKQYYVVANG